MANESHGDIRAVTAAEHWEHFNKAWVALKSYTYLGKTTPYLDRGATREMMPLRHDMRNSTGGVMAAPLCLLSPEPWWRDDECVPAPVTMTYDIIDPAYDVKRLETLRSVISIGRQMGFSRSRIVDADNHDRVIALSTGSGVSLGDVPPGFEAPNNPVNDMDDSPDLPQLRDVFGIERTADGVLEIAKVVPEISSPHAALHIGPINIALEAAATDALIAACGHDRLQVEHWSVVLVKPGFVGPFRATAAVVGVNQSTGRYVLEASMIDVGTNGRAIATAQASFRAISAR